MEIMNPIERLDYLLQSETIRLINSKDFTPSDLDRAMKNMKAQIEELKYQNYLDKSEIVRLRRQVDMLMEAEK